MKNEECADCSRCQKKHNNGKMAPSLLQARDNDPCEQFCPAGKCESENDMKNEECAACSRCQKKHNNDTPCEQFCPAGKCKDDDDMKNEECADCARCQKKTQQWKDGTLIPASS